MSHDAAMDAGLERDCFLIWLRVENLQLETRKEQAIFEKPLGFFKFGQRL